jgi:hypothetical protein
MSSKILVILRSPIQCIVNSLIKISSHKRKKKRKRKERENKKIDSQKSEGKDGEDQG